MGQRNYRRFVSLCDGADLFACIRECSGHGVDQCLPLPLIGGFHCVCDTRGEQKLRAHPDVVSIEADVRVQLVRPRRHKQASRGGDQVPSGLKAIRAPEAWAGTRGLGIAVAILDTGIDLKHPDLAANIRGGVNFVDPRRSPQDDNGHGTHVAGTVAALGNGTGVIGVAPQAGLYAVKVLDRNGSGSLLGVIQGLQWVVERRIPIANMSLGLGVNLRVFELAIRNAVAAGVTIVAAAGNDGKSNSVNYPARYPVVIAVSAVTDAGKAAWFSSRGPEVDLAAPGVSVLSTLPRSRYGTMSGTSMASPHVAGVAALYLAGHGGASPAGVMSALKATAVPLSGLSADVQGAGRVDALSAVTGSAADSAPAGGAAGPGAEVADASGSGTGGRSRQES